MEHNPTSNLVEKFENVLEFIHLLEDPTRMKILLLLLLYNRLSLTEISQLVKRTKPAVLNQLSKFLDVGIIKTNKKQGHGSYMENYYELIPNFMQYAVIGLDPKKEIPREIVKTIEILEFQAEKEVFNLASNVLLQFADLYGNLEQKAREFKEPFGIHHPPFELFFTPFSKKAYQYYKREYWKLMEKVNKLMEEEENLNENKSLERPMLLLNSFFPLKSLLDSENEKKS